MSISKVVYTDNNRDIALTGIILSEDETFLTLERNDRIYRIGKTRIVCVEEQSKGGKDGNSKERL